MKRILVVIPLVVLAFACTSQLPPVPELFSDFELIDNPTTPLSAAAKSAMGGVYAVVDQDGLLGDEVVGKWVGNRWCLWSQHDAVYSVNAGGSSGDSIKLTGFIRAIRSASGTKIRLMIARDDGAGAIVAGNPTDMVKIRGTKENGDRFELLRLRGIDSSSFHIMAHRGGGRNSDRLGISENCTEMIGHAALLGATGVEIDVRPTRDGQVIVFHDEAFSPRTVQGSYLLGRVDQFDLNQIRLFGKLINGEQIPTLSEALDYVIEKTMLSVVWIDLKNPEIIDRVIKIQSDAVNAAHQAGREVAILLGIPSPEILAAYNDSPLRLTTDILIEYDAATALSFPNCRAWAPRWTTSITAGDVDRMHAAGKLVFTWTVDLRESVIDYLPRVDGILSNYPSLVAGLEGSR
jgi:glycerophosphoryl diester phosphodiesterase